MAATIRTVRRLRPDLGVISMSANPKGSAPEDATLLDKPFTLDRLAECPELACKLSGEAPGAFGLDGPTDHHLHGGRDCCRPALHRTRQALASKRMG